MQTQPRPIQPIAQQIPVTIALGPHQISVKLLLFISNAFINTMGITQPSPQAANRAAWFIFFMLSAVIATVVTIAVLALRWAFHH